MLHAILNSKAGPVGLSEDLLTAGIFGRLRYLSGAAQARVMQALLGDAAHQLGQLQDLAFWPQYRLQGADQTRVEPDVLLRFEAGAVLIEVKRPSHGSQSVAQWTRELDGAVQAGLGAPLHLLALGGNTPDNTAGFDASRWPLEVQLHTREWQHLVDHIADLREHTELPSDQAVLADWQALLALFSLRACQRIDLPPVHRFIQQHRQRLGSMAQWLRTPTTPPP